MEYKISLKTIIFFLFFSYITSNSDIEIPEKFKKFQVFINSYQSAINDDQSKYDKYNNTEYSQYFLSPELRSQLYYIITKQHYTNYIISFNDYISSTERISSSEINTQSYFQMKIKIDPCKNLSPGCCNGIAYCENDNTEIIAKGDIEMVFSINSYLPFCIGDFNNEKCGVFIEIHRPGDESIIYEKKIDYSSFNLSGYTSTYFSAKSLCSGRYEIWFIFRTRSGNYLIYVKPFFVKFPSCTCSHVKSLGYEC